MRDPINFRNVCAILLIAILACASGCDATKSDKSNVIIIFIDDLGFGDLSSYGNPAVETPNIDWLASQGIRFTNFYVNSPICSPSRVALMTGQYPMRHKVHSYIATSTQNRERAMVNFLDSTAMTMAKVLKEHGYATGHFGKWHLGGGRDVGDVPLPKAYGFDESLVSFEGLGDRILFNNHGLSEQSAKLGNGEITWVEKHQSTGIYLTRALEFIDKAGDQPFFLNICPNDVHDPHLPEESSIAKWKSVTDNPYEQKFFAVLEDLDTQLGIFFEALTSKGVLENTMIVFTGDNGPTDWPYYYNRDRYPDSYEGELYPPGFTAGLKGRKWSLYEGGVREPFIFYWKGHMPAGQVDSVSVVSAIDLFPSICSMLKIEYPSDLDGVDKQDAFFGNPLVSVPPIMWEYGSNPGGTIFPGDVANKSPNLAIREGKWKLLVNADGSGQELFNLEEDPFEENNLALEKAELAAELTERLLNWRKTMPVEAVVN